METTNGASGPTNGSSGAWNAESRIIPLEPLDQWKPIDNIRTFVFLVVRAILNEEAMRTALNRLIRNHLPILGARLEAISKDGNLAYRLPTSFTTDYQLFHWSSDTVDSTFADAQLLPKVMQTDCEILHGPCTIPELEGKWTPSTWPKERKFERSDTPLLLVHITRYADATVVALNLPHAVTDQMGFGCLIEAWMQLVKGETPAKFLELEPGTLHGLENLSEKELRRKNTFRIMSKSERVRAILNFMPDLILNSNEVRRLLFLPISLIEGLRDRHTKALKAKYGEEAPALTSGDIIIALLAKLAYLGRKTSRTVAITSAMNCRGRHPALPADKPYLHNGTCYALLHTPNPDQVSLAELAYKHRLALVEGLKVENIERSWAVSRAHWKRHLSLHIVEPGQLSYSSTNWCGAWRNLDFGPAVVSREGDECPNTSPLVLGHALQRAYPTRYNTQIMCKADGGFWCDFTISAKRFPLVEKLLKSDPKLSNV
ncbi:BCL5p [Penicillium atrosanguineum]|uniref:BCL5p n=1 Tax=Penicillium atrosanguineum TaxID=1132637 RepID=A0A9W9PRB5_9EURO|nr:BCL5p [Penicillium atrosanguineum]